MWVDATARTRCGFVAALLDGSRPLIVAPVSCGDNSTDSGWVIKMGGCWSPTDVPVPGS